MKVSHTFPMLRFPKFKNDKKWEIKQLDNIVAINSGRDYKHLDTGDIPVYGTGGYMLSVNDKLSDVDAVGIGRKGTIDKPQYLKAPFWTVDTLFYLINKNNYNLRFIYYLAQTIDWKRYSEQTGVPSLSKTTISAINVVVPYINEVADNEQKKIADCLSALDKYIDATKHKLELLKEYKKGLMQRLFPAKDKTVPELRFPEFQNDGEWGWKKLGEFLYEHKTKSDGKCEVHSVSVSKGVINQKMYLGRNFAASDTSNYKLVKPNDVIYTKSPTGDFPFGIVKQSFLDYNAIVSPLYAVYSPTNRYVGYLIQAYFESPIRLNNYLYPIVKKGAKNTIQITNEEFLSRDICLPSNEREQQKIADCLSYLDNAIAALEKKNFELERHKKGLLQQLFPNNI